MSLWQRLGLTSGLFVVLLGVGPASAQTTPPIDEPDAEEPAPAPDAPAAPADTPSAKAPKEFSNGLYVSVAAGMAAADVFDTSVATLETDTAANFFELDELDFGRTAIGWRFPEDKGAVRIVFNGYKESSYNFRSTGLQASLAQGSTPNTRVPTPLEWWSVSASNGQLVSQRTPQFWTTADDVNMNGFAEVDEVQRLAPDANISVPFSDSMQNELQTVDLLYGRTFGGRRFSSRWWTGFRYYAYEGNVLSGAWLAFDFAGIGFTDGEFLRLLHLSQETTGFGPTGSWEADFHFFERRLELFLRAQTALTFSSLKMTSGEFFTLLRDRDLSDMELTITAPARFDENRDKSTWQNTIEAGARFRMRNGVEFELGYTLTGYLDVVITPADITIPERASQVSEGTSALFVTQDFVVDGWYAGVGFQF